MAGFSLWLCPPEGSHLEAALIRLISTTIPAHFGDEEVPNFQPHVTLTSDIPTSINPQEVVDGITISELPKILFSCMKIGDTFFTRGTLHLVRTSSILELASQCRRKFTSDGQSQEKIEKWTNEKFIPHLSLVYSKLWPISKEIRKEMEHDVIAANIGIPCSRNCCESRLQDTMSGWEGGKIILVSTDKPIDEWVPLATRNL